MNFNLSTWSIKNPVPTIVFFLVLTILGVISFMHLGIDENPNIDVPLVSVTVTQLGAAPAELETQVTRKVEDSIAGIGNIKHIASTVSDGASTTSIEFNLGTNTDRAVNDVRDAVSKIRQDLPQGIEEPIIQRIDFVGGPFVTYTVESEKLPPAELSWVVDNDIARALLSVKGVGQVQRAGGVDREIRVKLNPTRLEALGITADTINMQLRQLNINLPGGRGEIGRGEQSIRFLGSAETVNDLAHTDIMLPSGKHARLDTLGTVEDSTSDVRQAALLNNKPVVAFSVVRSSGSNLVDVEKGVDKKIKELQESVPGHLKIVKIRSNSRYIKMSYDASFESLVEGALLAVIVVFLFLRDIRATALTALAIPLSVVPTFAVMDWAGFTLNGMSLLGLSLVIGILVDDAIVEIENIVRHLRMGKKPFIAAIEAAEEIGLAVIATTMTIVVVFVPVAAMGGIPGQFFKQFGLTVTVAVLFSLLVARMVTPMIAAYFMKDEYSGDKESQRPQLSGELSQLAGHQKSGSWFMKYYEPLLNWALAHRPLVVVAAFILFGASIALFKSMPTSLMSNMDRGETLLNAELPPGSDLADTMEVSKQATSILLKHAEVANVVAFVGTPSSNGHSNTQGDVTKATIYISLKPREERKLTQQQFEESVRDELHQIPGTRLSFSRSGGLGGKPFRMILAGSDAPALERTARDLESQMRSVKGLYDITSSAAVLRPEILVTPDFDKAARQGVSVQSIARTALIATLGDSDANLAKFNLDDRQVNIRVQIDPKYRNDVRVIDSLKVSALNGRLVPLSSVARVDFGSGPFQIDRFDRMRQVTLESSMDSQTSLGEAMKQVHELPAFKNMPAGIIELPLGDAEIQRDVFNGFGTAIGSAVMLIYAVLVVLFGGFLHPLTIMMSLPLSLCGALIGLVCLHQSIGLYALIGITMLMGLVTKNAILLVEYGLMAMKNGLPQRQAIVLAGETRMQPILMTTIAMIAGMLPIALGLGAGSEVRSPMAISVIGGLITSTAFTLIVIPVVFTYIDDFQNWLRKSFLGKGTRDTSAAGNGNSTSPKRPDSPAEDEYASLPTRK
ncbi:MAG: efflux RND transporter permease subunit [Cyanobacteria bacterium SZAS TMP-1]|nr:efflux RND transporter permease subunit [Cyanobacteria bacterium SZAS TMP-1]